MIFSQTIVADGGEFSVLGPLPGDQTAPQLGFSGAGGFLVWQDNSIDPNGSGVAAQRLDADLNLSGSPFGVNQTTLRNQELPQVATFADGSAVVVWQGGKLGFQNIYARFLAPDGTFLTREIGLGTSSTSKTNRYGAWRWVWNQNRLQRKWLTHKRIVKRENEMDVNPDVAALPDGSAVVVYSGTRKVVTNVTDWVPQMTWRAGRFYTNSVSSWKNNHVDWMHDVLFQRVSASGKKEGSEIVVNQFRDFNQRRPSVAVLGNGNVVVVWSSEQEFATPLAAALEHLFNNPNIDPPSSLAQVLGENRLCISARILTADGAPVTDEFRIDGDGAAICGNASVSALPNGGFTVAWNQRDTAVRSNRWDVYTRNFGADGVPAGPAARLNTFTWGDQFAPQIGTVNLGQFIVWTSMGQDTSGAGVYGRAVSEGVPVGPEIQVHTSTRFAQKEPTIAPTGNDSLLVVWSHLVGVANGMDLEGQKYYLTGGSGGTDVAATEEQRRNSGVRPPPLPPPPPGSESIVSSSSASGPRIAIRANSEKVVLTWNTEAGRTYQVQSSTDLSTWTNAGAPQVAATDSETLALEPGSGTRFYRVMRLP